VQATMQETVFSPARSRASIETPTLILLALTYAAWAAATVFAGATGPWVAVPVVAVILALHSSLQHEMLHGHPFRNQRLNDALVFPALGLLVPYERFKEMHIAHHYDPLLTDPYDDPESNYLDPAVWDRLGRPMRLILSANNTLLGRMVIGPVIGMIWMWREDARLMAGGDRAVVRAYGLHALGVVPVVAWLLWVGTMSVWAYLLACWGALGILRIRTFLEHQAHERSGPRSVIIEDRGPLALIFLNNNYHAVHHAHPKLPWYELPRAYSERQDQFLRRNGGYRYASYAEVFRRHLLRRKDPVAHPLWTGPAGPGEHPVSGRRLHE
jgi:fatty acid desaturase